METASASIKKNSILSKLEQIVLDNLENEGFNVKAFAGLAGMSRSELYRKIKKHSGKSVTQFIRDIRLRKALKLLSQGELSASEAGFAVGFNSATYFSKCFKDKYGFTPGETEFHQAEIPGLLNHSARPRKKDWFGVQLVYYPVVLTALIIVVGTIIWMNTGNSYQAGSMSTPPPDQNATSSKGLENSSVAILPFTNWTGDPTYDPICYGTTVAIINKLSDINSINKVAPMSAVIPYKDSVQNLKNISRDLDVENILSGSVQEAGSQLKFTIEFINAKTNGLLWSEEFIIDWEPEEAFTMQNTIAEEVISVLGIEDPSELDRGHPTASKEAYNYFLQGIYQFNIYTREAWENSIYFFDKAIEADPNYIEAYLYLSYIWRGGGLIWSYTSQQEAWDKARENLLKVLELDPDNRSVPYFLKDGYFYFELNAGKIPEIVEVNVEDHIGFNADYAIKMGRYEAAYADNAEYSQQEPYTGVYYALMAIDNYFLKDTAQSVKLLEEHYELYKNDLNFLREAAKCYYFLGDQEGLKKAIDHFYITFREERPPVIRWLKAMAAENMGDTVTRNEQLQSLRKDYELGNSGSPAWFIAVYYAGKGDYEAALDWLERSYEAREVEMTWLAQEPDLAPLGPSPRYQALLDSMNFPPAARTHVKALPLGQD